MPTDSSQDESWMALAIELAAQGRGLVEPNPMVGAVIVRDGQELGRGWHRGFGQRHAEVDAMHACPNPKDATMYVNLEPCCHHGKTPPCTDAVVRSGIRRVVVATSDPYAEVNGRGIEILRKAGIEVDIGVGDQQAKRLNAAYFKRQRVGRPWVIAKWAMSLDGRIATGIGDSKWITCEAARQAVHELRGRVDAIIIGRNTALADDPLLTARPPGPRQPLRVVFDSRIELPNESRLLQTAALVPLLIVASKDSDPSARNRVASLGAEVLLTNSADRKQSVLQLLSHLGNRSATNVLVEGGGELLGSFFDAGEVDEVYAFVAPKLIGGQDDRSPIGGAGVDQIAQATQLEIIDVKRFGSDVCIHSLNCRETA